ncbi:MAG: peptide deformylase [Planctomycetota bacterium]|nr:peptide deformylase [Planctomycetota bacterium]
MPDSDLLPIVLYPDPFLNQKARPLSDEEFAAGQAEGHDLARLLERMKATMRDADGIGLAAPQVGIGLRLFVMQVGEEGGPALAVFNPELSELEGAEESEEGCLSIPEVRAKVKRATKLKLNARDVRGAPFELTLADLPARVVQHEYDHLDGVLFISKIGAAARFLLRRKLGALEDEYKLLKKRRERNRSG